MVVLSHLLCLPLAAIDIFVEVPQVICAAHHVAHWAQRHLPFWGQLPVCKPAAAHTPDVPLLELGHVTFPELVANITTPKMERKAQNDW